MVDQQLDAFAALLVDEHPLGQCDQLVRTGTRLGPEVELADRVTVLEMDEQPAGDDLEAGAARTGGRRCRRRRLHRLLQAIKPRTRRG